MSWEASQKMRRIREKEAHPEKYCTEKKCLRYRDKPENPVCGRCLARKEPRATD